jgi:hypothetical protein
MAVPVFVASSSLTPTECVLDTNNVHVAAVPLSFMGEFSAVLAPTAYTPTLQVPIHRPMSWPSFRCIHADGDEERPLPWPSEIDIYELPSSAVEKVSHGSSSDLVIQALGESTIMKLFAATLVQSLEKNLKVTSPLAYSKLLSSQPKESLVLNSMRKSNDSYDQFPCAI